MKKEIKFLIKEIYLKNFESIQFYIKKNNYSFIN